MGKWPIIGLSSVSSLESKVSKNPGFVTRPILQKKLSRIGSL